MGFDLSSRKRNLGEGGYYRASFTLMILLRTAMIAAGVDPDLVRRKFVGNDGFRVTASESRLIASGLLRWVEEKPLVFYLEKPNPSPRKGKNEYLEILKELGGAEDRTLARHFPAGTTIAVRLSSGMKKATRDFAEFCDRSGGFTVN